MPNQSQGPIKHSEHGHRSKKDQAQDRSFERKAKGDREEDQDSAKRDIER